jgi:hypothetical protein
MIINFKSIPLVLKKVFLKIHMRISRMCRVEKNSFPSGHGPSQRMCCPQSCCTILKPWLSSTLCCSETWMKKQDKYARKNSICKQTNSCHKRQCMCDRSRMLSKDTGWGKQGESKVHYVPS